MLAQQRMIEAENTRLKKALAEQGRMDLGYVSDSAKKRKSQEHDAVHKELVLRLDHYKKSADIILDGMRRRKPELMEGLQNVSDGIKAIEEATDRMLRALEMAERNERWASGKSSLMAEREQIDRHMMIAGTISDGYKKASLADQQRTPTRSFEERNIQTSASAKKGVNDSNKSIGSVRMQTPKKDKSFDRAKSPGLERGKSPGHIVKEREKD